MFSRIFLTISLTALALSAQNPDGSGTSTPGGTTLIYPPPVPAYKELQQYLTLTDQQVTSLSSIQTQKEQALQAIFKQAGDKQTEMYQLLQSGSTDYVRIGQLMVEINNLQKQYPGPTEPYRSQALAVLTPAQKTKLQALADALNLGTPAGEAVQLNLLDYPNRPINILPASTGVGVVTGGAAVPPTLAITPSLAIQRR